MTHHVPVGTVCAFAGQVTPSDEGSKTVWNSTECANKTTDDLTTEKDKPTYLIESAEWMLCDGRYLGTARYPLLWGVLAFLYGRGAGKDGEVTFRIPDYRGLFLRGVDHGSGLDPDAAKRTGPQGTGSGSGVGSLQCDTLQDHTHSYNEVKTAAPAKEGQAAGMSSSPTPTTSPNDPARTSSETRPRNIAVNYIIRCR